MEERTPSEPSQPPHQPTIISYLKDGEINEALDLLRLSGGAALVGLSVLEEVLPLAMTTIAELYDKYGVTGREGPYFDFARELWNYLPSEQRWVLPLVQQSSSINIHRIASDRMYELNQLRHSALYYTCKNGSFELFDLLTNACGKVSPLVLEAKLFERNRKAALALGQRPPQPVPLQQGVSTGGVGASSASVGRGSVADVAKRASEPDVPSLYLAIRGGHGDFIRHALHSLRSTQLQTLILRTIVIHAIIPLDDSDSAHALYMFCLDPSMPPHEAPVIRGREGGRDDECANVDGVTSTTRILGEQPGRSASDETSTFLPVDVSVVAQSNKCSIGSETSTSAAPILTSALPSSFRVGPTTLGVPAVSQKRSRANTGVSTSHLSHISGLSSRRGSVTGNAPIDMETTLFSFAVARDSLPSSASPTSTPVDPALHSPARVHGGMSSEVQIPMATEGSSCTPSSVASVASNSSRSIPYRQYFALHLCFFLHEGSAEPSMERWPPSRRYAEWLLRVVPWVVFQPVQSMQWTGLTSVAPNLSSGTAHASVVAVSSDAPSGMNKEVLPTASAAVHLWSDWLPFHSACAAGVLDVAQRLANLDRNSISAPAKRIGHSGASPIADIQCHQPVLMHPARIAVEASYRTKRYDVVGWLTQMLSPAQLDIHVYAQCRYLNAAKPDFVKILCKNTPLSIRAFRQGSGTSGVISGKRSGPGRAISAQHSIDTALEAADTSRRVCGSQSVTGSAALSGSWSGGGSREGDLRADLSAAIGGKSDTMISTSPASRKTERRRKAAGRVLKSTDDGGNGQASQGIERDTLPSGIVATTESVSKAGVARSKLARIVRFRPRSASPRSPRVQSLLDEGCRPNASGLASSSGIGGQSIATEVNIMRSSRDCLNRTESNASLQSLSRRSRAVSLDAGALSSISTHVLSQAVATPNPVDLPKPRPAAGSIVVTVESGALCEPADGFDEFESVASRKARRRAIAATMGVSAPPSSPDYKSDALISTAAHSTASCAPLQRRQGPTSQRTHSISQPVFVAPPVALPTYAASVGLGDTILPAQTVLSQEIDKAKASSGLLGLGSLESPTIDHRLTEKPRGMSSIPLRNLNHTHERRSGLLSELDGWLAGSSAAVLAASHVAASDVASAGHQSIAGEAIAIGRSVGPVPDDVPNRVSSAASPSPKPLAELEVGPLRFQMELSSLVGIGTLGTAIFVGKCGRLGATIKRFDKLLHPVAPYLTTLARLHDLCSDDIVDAAVRSGLEGVLRYLGDSENVSYIFIAFEPCDSTLTRAIDSLKTSPGQDSVASIADRGVILTRWCKQIIAAVAALHATGVVHGALHFGNLLLRGRSVRVADSGLAPSLVLGAANLLLQNSESSCSTGLVVMLEQALRHCSHGFIAPEAQSMLDDLLSSARLPCSSWAHKALKQVNVLFTAAADAFALGHLLNEIVSGDLSTRDSPKKRGQLPPVTLLDRVRQQDWSHPGIPSRSIDPITLDLVHRFTRFDPALRMSASLALRHPMFCSREQRVGSVTAFCEQMLLKYGENPPFTTAFEAENGISRIVESASPEIAYLERAYELHERQVSSTVTGNAILRSPADWTQRIDPDRRIAWDDVLLSQGSRFSAQKNFLTPRLYLEHYGTGRPCLGQWVA